ncbi:hypothetical protein ACFFMN_22350, partial [Planobispora siamensis]|uniref:hypothetical protein n=1 Tax=Planobispora siamensis TaxID=936338 RepID=UPI0035E9DBA1
MREPVAFRGAPVPRSRKRPEKILEPAVTILAGGHSYLTNAPERNGTMSEFEVTTTDYVDYDGDG